MRQNFLNLLGDFLRLSNIIVGEGIQLISAGMSYTSEELLNYFLENPTIKIEIKNLNLNRLPNETDPLYRLYNPRETWNPITWGAVAETVQVGNRNIIFEAERTNPDAELNRGPLPKAYAQIGEIEEVSTRSENGNIVVRKRTSNEEIRIEIPATPTNVEPIIEAIANQIDSENRLAEWEIRMDRREGDELRGTLFNPTNE